MTRSLTNDKSWKSRQAGGRIPAGSFPFQCAFGAGGAGVSTDTLGRSDFQLLPRRHNPRYSEDLRRSETRTHYRVWNNSKGFSRIRSLRNKHPRLFRTPPDLSVSLTDRCSQYELLHGFLNGRFCQRRHDFVSCIVRMQPVIRQIFLQQSLVIDESRKIIQIDDLVLGAIFL